MTAATRSGSSSRIPSEAARAATDLRLSVEQASYAYAPNPHQAPVFTLEATSFQAKAGEVVAVLGPNASGKSTLLQIISGALPPLSGRSAGKPAPVSIESLGVRSAGPPSLRQVAAL